MLGKAVIEETEKTNNLAQEVNSSADNRVDNKCSY